MKKTILKLPEISAPAMDGWGHRKLWMQITL